MGINNKYLEKYKDAYTGLPTIRPALTFEPTSPYYRQEEWRWVLDCFVPGVRPNLYKISNYGRVYSYVKSPCYPNGGIMIPSKNEKGYHQINLGTIPDYNKRNKVCCKVARLVMLHFRFVENCYLYEVDHLDGNKDNNTIWNLEWVTPQENTHRAIINGQRSICTHNNCNTVLLTDEQAYQLFAEADRIDPIYYEGLSKKYGVTVQYIDSLVRGYVRPYIANMYYSKHTHVPSDHLESIRNKIKDINNLN